MHRLMRKVFLWFARNAWMRERLPQLPFMQKAVRRFMPGETIDDALAASVDLNAIGIGTMYTKLGENIADASQAQAVADHYLELLARIKAADNGGEISVKPTQLGLDLDEDMCLGHLRTLSSVAEAQGSYLWIDMEDSSYVDRTLDIYQRLRSTHARTGICLQAYLKRTVKDVERLLPLGPAIRLVKGAYDEPAAVAFRSSKEVDANYLGLAVTLARESRSRPVRLGLGTHDVGADRADRVARGRSGRAQGRLRDRDAVRDPGEGAAPLRARRLQGAGAHRLRRRVVPVVHAPARRAPRQRPVRAPPGAPWLRRAADPTCAGSGRSRCSRSSRCSATSPGPGRFPRSTCA